MNDKKYLLDTIKALDKLKQQLKSTHEKILEKAFIKADTMPELKYILESYTKADLDINRQCLDISGISSFKKLELASALNNYINNSLKSILKRLTEKEYKFVKLLIKNNGIIPFTDKYSDITLYLRKLGIAAFVNIEEEKFIVIPKDILAAALPLLDTIEVYQSIRLNEKINQLLKGMLYYYGVLDFSCAYQLIHSYLKENTEDMIDVISVIYENYWKDYGIFICDDYLCYDYIDDYKYIADEQRLRASIGYKKFSKEELLAVSEDNFFYFNNYDVNFIFYLTSNYEISKKEAEEFTAEIKLDIRNCYDFNDIMHEIKDSFSISDYKQLDEFMAIVTDLYNNCSQWVLKGFTANEIKKMNSKDKLNSKIRRNLYPNNMPNNKSE